MILYQFKIPVLGSFYPSCCYSRNSRAIDARTIPESYVTLNPVTQFHNHYVTVDIVSLLALQILLQNSIPLCYRYATVMLPLTLYLGHK